MTKTASEVREYLISRTGNHPEDIRQANAIADEIDRLRAALKRYAYPPDHRVSVAEAECDRLRAALEMLYDKWENGDPCYADPETFMGGLGNAFKLTAEEEEGVLALIGRRPENCHKPLPHEPVGELSEEACADLCRRLKQLGVCGDTRRNILIREWFNEQHCTVKSDGERT